MKEKDSRVKGRLGEMQAKAQLDALKRFITSMENEIVDKKHKAQEIRTTNNVHDHRIKVDTQKRLKQVYQIGKDNQEQGRNKIKREQELVRKDREVPDISGDEGYPRIYEISKKDARDKKVRENDNLATELRKQMASQRAWKEQLDSSDAEHDRTYLSGWGHKKDVKGQHYATSGNLGKMAGPSYHDHLKKTRDAQQMKEVWHKVNAVKQLKTTLGDQMNMIVDEDKLDHVLNTAKKQL